MFRSTILFLLLTLTTINGQPHFRTKLEPAPPYMKASNYTMGVLVWTGGLPDLASCATIAINDINNRTDILPTHNIDPYFKDSGGDPRVTLHEALELVGNDWAGVTTPPIVNSSVVLGPLRSVSSILANQIYELKKVPGVSSTSTSVELGNPQTFPFFSRVIGSDAQQGAAMAAFCHRQGWYKVAILFTSDSYSSSITTEFLKAGRNYVPPVEAVVATSFISTVGNTIQSTLDTQANLILSSKSVVIYAPIVRDDLIYALREFGKLNMNTAPYIWMGADGWFDLDNAPVGSIMSSPYTPQVGSGYAPIDRFNTLWTDAVARNISTVSTHSFFCPYQYDAVYLIAYAMEGLQSNMTACTNPSRTAAVNNSAPCVAYRADGEGGLLNALMHVVAFDGATGRVDLSSTGERLTSWGFINKIPSVTTGVTNQQTIGRVDLASDTYEVFNPNVYYPGEGLSQTPPRSFPEEITVQNSINRGFWVFVVVVSVLIMVLCLIAMILAVVFRERPIMRLSSYRINNVTTLGVVMCLVALILYGVDEGTTNATLDAMNLMCIARPWLFDMGFNIFFLPMFSKVYRVNRIFNQVVSVVIISDIELLSPVLVFCVIDFFILVVWTTVDPLRRDYQIFSAPVEDFSNMRITTTNVGVCTSSYASIFYLILVLLKGIPSIYGALMAFQTRKVFIKAMRDSIQIGAILILVVIIAFFEVAISFVIRDPTAEYILLSVGVLVVAVSTLGFVWGGKYFAIYTGQEDKWTSDPYKHTKNGGTEASTRTGTTPEASYVSSRRGLNTEGGDGKTTGDSLSPSPRHDVKNMERVISDSTHYPSGDDD